MATPASIAIADDAPDVAVPEAAETAPETPEAIKGSVEETVADVDSEPLPALAAQAGEMRVAYGNVAPIVGFDRYRVTHGSLQHDGVMYAQGAVVTLPPALAESLRHILAPVE